MPIGNFSMPSRHHISSILPAKADACKLIIIKNYKRDILPENEVSAFIIDFIADSSFNKLWQFPFSVLLRLENFAYFDMCRTLDEN